jgi:serine/threonine protein kinase
MHKLVRSRCHPSSGQRFTAAGREYEFMGAIGNGAVGLVRKARDLSEGTIVAVKILAPDPKYIDSAVFDDVEQRFKREGIRGSRLRDPNLIEIISYEENDDGSCFRTREVKNPFIVMEYIRGCTLESLIKNLASTTSLPTYFDPALRTTHLTKQTLSIASGVANALRYLHDRKVVHRDVKPANIFIAPATPGSLPSFVKLGDFGVTKWGDFLATAASGTLTVTMQQGLGTLKYMSPEQAVRPKNVSVRSDIFSLGITLFELFTGRILPSPHHVFEIMTARTSRDSVIGKLLKLGVKASYNDAALFELVLDMFLMGVSGRPTSTTVSGRMVILLERISERESI